MIKCIGLSYVVKSFNCEICKEPYPISIKYKDNVYNLLTYSIPENQNYVILESLNSIKENEYPLSIHILIFNEEGNSFILGRGHESDIRVSDISVSRSHSKIILKNNEFILEDLGSKFGSLVLAKDPIEIDESSKTLQIGRTLLSCSFNNKFDKKSSSKSMNEVKDGKGKSNSVNNAIKFDFNIDDNKMKDLSKEMYKLFQNYNDKNK